MYQKGPKQNLCKRVSHPLASLRDSRVSFDVRHTRRKQLTTVYDVFGDEHLTNEMLGW